MNCLKLTLSENSVKNELTIRSPNGLIASSGILKKSSLLNVPQSPLSNEVNREYKRSIWFGVTKRKYELDLFFCVSVYLHPVSC